MQPSYEQSKLTESIMSSVKDSYRRGRTARDSNAADIAKWAKVIDSAAYGTEVAHKSQYVSDLTKKLIGWQLPSLVSTLTNGGDVINCEAFSANDFAQARQDKKVLTFQFIQSDRYYKFITSLATTVLTKGTVFVKTGWDFKEVEKPVTLEEFVASTGELPPEGADLGTKTVVTVNKPYREVIQPESVCVDPSCKGDMQKAMYVIHDWEASVYDLQNDSRYDITDSVLADIGTDEEGVGYADDANTPDEIYMRRVIVHEYWGILDIGNGPEPVVVAWVNGSIIRSESNPLPSKNIPFTRGIYSTLDSESLYGESLAEHTAKNQHIDSVLHRGVFDDMKSANNGQLGIKKGFTDDKNLSRMVKGHSFQFNTSMNDVYTGKYTPINASVFGVLSKNEQAAESSVGVSLLGHGTGGNALGSSAAAVNATTTSSAKREMHIINGLVEDCIIPTLEKYLEYNREFLSPEEVSRITDAEYVESSDESVYNVKVTVESAEIKAAKIQSTGFVLQTMAPSMPHDVQMKLLSRYITLTGEEDLGRDIEEYSPEPDPVTQRVQELEIEKLQAQVDNEKAKALENTVDVALKEAKTEHEKAKMRHLNSTADITDLDYIEREQGLPHQRRLEERHAESLHKQTQENNKQGWLSKVKQKVGS